MRGWRKHAVAALAELLLITFCAGRGNAQSTPAPLEAPASGAPSPGSPPATETQAPEPPPPPETQTSEPPPPPVAPPPPALRRYGDQGTVEIALGLGYSSVAGFLAAGGFRYFVIDGLAPGFEGSYVHGGTTVAEYGLALASLRVVPVRASSVALVLTGRGGRVFLADHVDGWGAGAGAGIIIALGGGAGVEIGYEFLRLFPASFCADLSTCVLHGLVLGLRFSF